jgi:hypothetical protein
MGSISQVRDQQGEVTHNSQNFPLRLLIDFARLGFADGQFCIG